MQIAFGRVRRKTAPTASGVKTRAKNGELNDSEVNLRDFIFYHLFLKKWIQPTNPATTMTQ